MEANFKDSSQLMTRLQKQLNNKLSDIFLNNYHYSFFDNSQLNRYSFFIEGIRDKKINPYDISYNFKIYYDNLDINYAVIEWANVIPQETGVGTKLTSCFLEELRSLNKIKTVYLNPKNDKAEHFWRKNGFDKLCKNKIVGDIEYNMFLTL